MTIIGADEIHAKISSLIESQFPEFIRDDGPRFVAFLKAYYEYLDQDNKAGSATRKLYDYNDIDRTLDAFVEEFRREFLVNIPKTVISDKRLLTKHIIDFYRSRGSKPSYRFMFRALFDIDVDFYYPSEDILRASDGRWVKTTTIFVGAPFVSNILNFEGKDITDQTSGATARVQEVIFLNVNGVDVYRLTVEFVSGEFQDGSVIQSESGEVATILSTTGSLIDISIVDGGAYHNAGDTVTITGSSSGASATGTVLSAGVVGAATIKIIDGGSGYRVSNTVVRAIDGSGTGLDATITAVSNTEVISFDTQIIEPLAPCVLNTYPFFVSAGANTAAVTAEFATANVSVAVNNSLTFSNTTVGSIDTIRIDDPGYGYTTLPTIEAIDQEIADLGLIDGGDNPGGTIKGQNALLLSNTAPGTISTVSILSGGATFIKGESVVITNRATQTNISETYTDHDSLTRTTIRQSHYSASGQGNVSGVVVNTGRYFGTTGFLSWDKKLQDNYYYQTFSYVIRASEQLLNYSNLIKTVLHPAGSIMFTQYELAASADMPDLLAVSNTAIE